MHIDTVTKQDYAALITIWEASVRATHNFLAEGHIAYLKPLILAHYFDAVELRCAKNDIGGILGFVGVAEQNVEMLFVSPEYFGQGVGTFLLKYAIENQHATKVDVNEQNPQAVGFYEHMGFNVVGRSPLDGQGNPFPLLHMMLA